MSWPELPRVWPRGSTRPALLLAWFAACIGGIDGPDRTDEIRVSEFTPPSVYVVWWDEAKECSGWEGDFSELVFYSVHDPTDPSGQSFRCYEEGRRCQGRFELPNRIYIAEGLIEFEWIVKHEMLHALGAREHSMTFLRCSS